MAAPRRAPLGALRGGLEGGLDVVHEDAVRMTFLESWACVADRCRSRGIWTCRGVLLPAQHLRPKLWTAVPPLSAAIDAYAGGLGIRDVQGTWGVLTRNLITRQDAFRMAVIHAFAPFYNAALYARRGSPDGHSADRGPLPLRIAAQAPTRIDLAGGTLDIWPLYLFHPGAVTVNCAITRHASCVIETAPRATRVAAHHAYLGGYAARRRASRPWRNLRRALFTDCPAGAPDQDLPPAGRRLTLTTNSRRPRAPESQDASPALAVALCAALDRLTGAGWAAAAGIHISRDAEAIVIRVPTGTQDHYPAAFGGVSAIHLEPGGERREALGCDIEGLENRLVLCYTGKPRQSGINNWEVFKRHMEGDRRVQRNLRPHSGCGA